MIDAARPAEAGFAVPYSWPMATEVRSTDAAGADLDPSTQGHVPSTPALRAMLKLVIWDLDDTLWKGILGEIGVAGVSWCLESKSQAHALYQQALASLAESGVLLAIVSKNDPFGLLMRTR